MNLAIGRDSTALLESYHLRPEVAVARFRMLPVLKDFPVEAVPKSPRPNDSPLYNSIRTRVRTELFPEEGKNKHRQGGDFATCVILGFAVFAYSIYYAFPSLVSRRVARTFRRMDRSDRPALRQPRRHESVASREQFVRLDGRFNRRIFVDVEVPPPSVSSHPLQRQRVGSRCLHGDAVVTL